MNNSVKCVALIGLLGCYVAPSFASTPTDLKQGKWRYKTEMKFVSGQLAGQTKRFTHDICNPKEGDLAKVMARKAQQSGANCDKPDVSKKGAQVITDLRCTRKMGSGMQMNMAVHEISKVSSDGQSLSAHGTESVTFKGAPAQMSGMKGKFRMAGKRVGDCEAK